MLIKQLSVFIENREGRMEQVTEILKDNQINIASLSLADTAEYGLLRMIVTDPQKAKLVLKEAGFSAKLTDVIAVKLKQEVGTLYEMLKTISQSGNNVEYMYTLANGDETSIVIKVSNVNQAIEALSANGFSFQSPQEAYKFNS